MRSAWFTDAASGPPFYGMTRVFPWFAEARGGLSFLAHLIFGLVAADAYLKLERKEAGASEAGLTG
jgi:hypothetical protein